MAVNIDSYGISRTYNNGQLINSVDYDANYDGDELNLAIQSKDGKFVYMKMDNDEIMQLFNGPMHKKPLHERIENDYKTYKSHYLNNKTRKGNNIKLGNKTKRQSKRQTKRQTKRQSKRQSKRQTKIQTKSKTDTFIPLNSYIKSIDKTIY